MRLTDLKSISRDELDSFVTENIQYLVENEALAALDNPYATPRVCQLIAQNARTAGFYSVRLKLVGHRQTPQAHAVKLIHYLYWPDLVRLSVDMTVPPTVRRAIDNLLLTRVEKLNLGEKIASARRCSHALIKVLLLDPDPKVFASLLVNQRLREDDLVYLVGTSQVTVEKLILLAAHRKWVNRYAIRKALVLNPLTPRSTAASQLQYLSRRDRHQIYQNPTTSTSLRRCIERMSPPEIGDSADPAG
jgi:hypothetical protein